MRPTRVEGACGCKTVLYLLKMQKETPVFCRIPILDAMIYSQNDIELNLRYDVEVCRSRALLPLQQSTRHHTAPKQ